MLINRLSTGLGMGCGQPIKPRAALGCAHVFHMLWISRVHRVWTRVGFRSVVDRGWGCRGDRLGSGQAEDRREIACSTVAVGRVGALTCPSCSLRRRRCRTS